MIAILNILISLLLLCLVLGLGYTIAKLCISLLPDPFRPTADVVVKVCLLLCLLYFLIGFCGLVPGFRPIHILR